MLALDNFFVLNPAVDKLVTGQYDTGLVALSLAIAIGASYLALTLAAAARRSTTVYLQRLHLISGSASLGFGIWSMHCIGMLAFEMPADDVPQNLELLTVLLTQRNHHVATAINDEQALELYYREVFDLILLDVMMPGTSGYAVCETLKANTCTSNIPVIFVTALSGSDEWGVMQTHPAIGAEIIGDDGSSLLDMAREVALNHHEKWDGSGYPKGLKGTDIPVSARIVALADVFDALTSERPYKSAWPLDKATGLIREQAGKHFDPDLVEAFFQCLPAILEIRERWQEA